MNDFVNTGNRVVLATSSKVQRFATTWPCSGMRDLDAGALFSYALNGDLIDIQWYSSDTGADIAEPQGIDGAALSALADDARIVAFDPFYDAEPCHVEHTTILNMYLHGALQPGETL